MNPNETPTEPKILIAKCVDDAARIEELWGRALKLVEELQEISHAEQSVSLRAALSKAELAMYDSVSTLSRASQIARRDAR